jgi:RND family efflux transporter MFP subunit
MPNVSDSVVVRNGASPDIPPALRPPKRRRVRAWHVAGVVLVLAVAGLIIYALWPVAEETQARALEEEVPAAAAQVEAVVVKPMVLPLRAEATGHLTPWRRAVLSAEADGLVTERPYEEGQRVQAGRVLLVLDGREASIALQEAEAELLKAQATYAANMLQSGAAQDTYAVDTLQSGATPDTSRLTGARQALREAEVAFERRNITEVDLRAVRRRFEVERLRSSNRRGDVQAASSGLAQAEQRVARARLDLDRRRLRAPFPGRLADLDAEVGERVGVGQAVATLLDDRQMKVEVDVLESDLVRLTPSGTAWVHVPALGSESGGARFRGRLHAVNPSVDPATGTGRVTVVVPNDSGRLLAGLFANVSLEMGRLDDRLVVPAEAVLVRQGRDLVFRVQGGRGQWTYVTVGARSGELVEITDGLSPGDTVLVDNHFALAHDAPVEVVTIRPVLVK